MPDKWDRVRDSFERSHNDLGFPEATFENYTGATYNPDTGQKEGGSWSSIGTAEVEFVPPSVDSTVSIESGTSLGFDTSLRLPQSAVSGLSGSLVPYGEDSQKPTRITVEGTEYELQGNPTEHGSGMLMLRVTEK